MSSNDMIQLTLTLKMTAAQVVEMSVIVDNSPIQDFPMKWLLLMLHSWTFLGIKTIESVLADVSFVGNFSLLLMESLTTAPFSKVYFIFFKAVCKDILSLLECYKATLYADKCRRRRWKEGCEFTCCKCDKFRYILWHIVFNQNFIKNETRIFFVVLQAWQDIAIKTWAQSPRPQLFKR